MSHPSSCLRLIYRHLVYHAVMIEGHKLSEACRWIKVDNQAARSIPQHHLLKALLAQDKHCFIEPDRVQSSSELRRSATGVGLCSVENSNSSFWLKKQKR